MRMQNLKSQIVFLCVLCGLCGSTSWSFAQKWEKTYLTGIFYGEGATFADVNKDGKADAISGPFIYDGPDFKNRHAYTKVVASDPLAYSRSFFIFAGDVNRDGWNDILVVG